MGNQVTKVSGCFPCKTVRWGTEQIKIIPARDEQWERKPLLDNHRVAVKIAEIKKTPDVIRPVAPPAPIVRPPKPKPHWNWWQKILRGQGLQDMIPAVIIGTIIVSAAAGPFGALVPAMYLLAWGAVAAYRKWGPNPDQLAAAQAVNNRLANKYQKKAQVMRSSGNIEQAQIYEQLVKRLK